MNKKNLKAIARAGLWYALFLLFDILLKPGISLGTIGLMLAITILTCIIVTIECYRWVNPSPHNLPPN